jgi:hypothetical protein
MLPLNLHSITDCAQCAAPEGVSSTGACATPEYIVLDDFFTIYPRYTKGGAFCKTKTNFPIGVKAIHLRYSGIPQVDFSPGVDYLEYIFTTSAEV